MRKIKLGNTDIEISAVGLGAMSFAGFFGAADDAESLRTLDAAQDLGIDTLDTAEIYGMGKSETIIGQHLQKTGKRFKIATKTGIAVKPTRHFNNEETYIRNALAGSFERLGVDYVELYYIHRREQERPIEEVAETMGKLIAEGKIGGWGLSEISPTTLRAANAVTPVSAVQSEYSMWTRTPEVGLIQECARLGVTFVPFSPVGRGILTDTPPDMNAVADSDFRRNVPRFQEPNYTKNLITSRALATYAHDNGWTTAGLSVAWVLAQGDHMHPIPGTRTAEHLQQWASADEIQLTSDQLAELEAIAPVGWASGDRYSDAQWIGPEKYS